MFFLFLYPIAYKNLKENKNLLFWLILMRSFYFYSFWKKKQMRLKKQQGKKKIKRLGATNGLTI